MATRPEPTPEQERRVADVRDRLNAHKAESGSTWAALALAIGIPQGTISSFGGNSYPGDCIVIAEKVERFFIGLEAQAALRTVAPKVPAWVATPFAAEIIATFRFAQSGKIVAIGANPGRGKSVTARHYRTIAPNVWLATMARSTARMQPMQIEVLKAMGIAEPKGTPQQLSTQIKARAANTGGLLIVDEAHELTDDAIEELRSWHDATGLGIALVGDYRVVAMIEGRKDRRDRAQIFSRLSKRLTPSGQASAADAEALLDAWEIDDAAMRTFARGVAVKPGALRSMTMMLELAAFAADGPLTLADLRAARGQLTSTLD